MKKLAAIFLGLIFLFNLGGYRLWYYLEEQRSDKRMGAILEKAAYDDAELVMIRIPLLLPYQANWKEYERTDGEIEVKGTIYKYVKRKVLNGELILLCLPHHDKMQVHSARDDFFKFANDLAQPTSGTNKPAHSGHHDKNPLSDYYLGSTGFAKTSLPGIHHDFTFRNKLGDVKSVPHISPEQPPDIIPS